MGELRAVAGFDAAIEEKPAVDAVEMVNACLVDPSTWRGPAPGPELRKDPPPYLGPNVILLGNGVLDLGDDPFIDGGQILARGPRREIEGGCQRLAEPSLKVIRRHMGQIDAAVGSRELQFAVESLCHQCAPCSGRSIVL
jgi:hypothetical protein